jgi:hypothetical protein
MRRRMKRPARLVLVCTTFALWLGAAANAQMSQEGSQQALIGLDSVGFFVEPLDDDDKVCGITEESVRDAFLYPISSSGLRFSGVSSGPLFHVQITTILQRQPRQCISSVMVHVFEFLSVPLTFAHESAPEVALVLWNDERLRVTDPSHHGERIRTAVRESAEKFLTSWNLANPSARR